MEKLIGKGSIVEGPELTEDNSSGVADGWRALRGRVGRLRHDGVAVDRLWEVEKASHEEVGRADIWGARYKLSTAVATVQC